MKTLVVLSVIGFLNFACNSSLPPQDSYSITVVSSECEDPANRKTCTIVIYNEDDSKVRPTTNYANAKSASLR